MIGKRISHYKILEKIGEGGMGVVYKAEDTKLKRTVALKFLPPELTRDFQAKARFIQEAQAAAALDHPNICTVHEIGETEGASYIVMPYVKGQSLKERIASAPLSVEEALAIAGQVAEGLKEAHERGIIHRDIKPANIMLTEKSQAKIMDFGLAKLEAGVDLTRTMAVIGTAAYMSPEQARGEEVDHRTDIWSFGATLYEMLTGQKPFGYKHDQALLYSILNDTTEAVSRVRPEISRSLDGVIQKALEKDRSRRYQNMAELLKDLRSGGVSGLSMPKAEKSIVVLPFEDISPSKDNQYFCDGITEEIITDLSQVGALRVISRTSAMMLKSTPKSIREIADMLQVQYVLEGSVRKAGSSLRVIAQVIDANTDAHLWADKYSGTLDDVFDMQEKVSRAIVGALKLKLTAAQDREIAKRPISNVLAHDFFLRARDAMYRTFTVEAIDDAIGFLESGLKITGDNALLLATLANVYFHGVRVWVKEEEELVRVEEYAQKALSLDPSMAQAYTVLGWVQWLKGNPREYARLIKQGLSLDPNNIETVQWAFFLYIWTGRTSKASELTDHMIELDPIHPFRFFYPSVVNAFEGRFDRAIDEMKRRIPGVVLEQPNWLSWLGWWLLLAGRLDEAKAALKPYEKMAGPGIYLWLPRIEWLALSGQKQRLDEETSGESAERAKHDSTGSCIVADLYVMLGDYERAITWLETAVDHGFINYPYFSKHDPMLAKLKNEPRFQKLMERVKYEWEHFEV